MKGQCPTAPAAIAQARDELFWKGAYFKAKVFDWGRQLATDLKGIYHAEGCISYRKMVNADDSGRLMIFASASAAEEQGFRKAKNCR